jgi:hypothetical protein
MGPQSNARAEEARMNVPATNATITRLILVFMIASLWAEQRKKSFI